MSKDYYKILEINVDSTDAEIKAAYRKLARKWHPDVAGNIPDVLKRFKEINEAYQILSDKNKKANYDSAKRFYDYAKGTNYANGVNGVNNNKKKKYTDNRATSQENTHKDEAKKSSFKFNWQEFILRKTQEKEYTNKSQAKRGKDIHTEVEISVIDAINGTTKTLNMLQTHVCPICKGHRFINGGVCSYCKGKGETSTYKKFNVKIPAGIKNNSKIRLAGEGEQGENGGINGDLYLTVCIKSNENYSTEGLNVLKTVQIVPYEAVLGSEIKFSCLGENYTIKINPNTKNGQKIRLNSCGLKDGNKAGDIIVTIEIQIPDKISNEEAELYKRLQKIASLK